MKKDNDSTVTTITSLNDAHYIAIVDNSTGKRQKITVADAKTEFDTGGALVYAAIISQTGTGAPTASVAINTTGATISFSRNGAGDYNITASGSIFTANKTIALITNGNNNNVIGITRVSATVLNMTSGSLSTLADDAIDAASLKIEIYT